MLDTTTRGTDKHRALREADEATALPRHWPVIAAVVIALVGLASHFFPWGIA